MLAVRWRSIYWNPPEQWRLLCDYQRWAFAEFWWNHWLLRVLLLTPIMLNVIFGNTEHLTILRLQVVCCCLNGYGEINLRVLYGKLNPNPKNHLLFKFCSGLCMAPSHGICYIQLLFCVKITPVSRDIESAYTCSDSLIYPDLPTHACSSNGHMQQWSYGTIWVGSD